MIVHAEVYEQVGHPMFPQASFVVVKFDDLAFVNMDRRRIKREQNRAIKKWRKQRTEGQKSNASRV